ncbi:hypothetical protein CR161_05560 [Prosthecochloris sp. ZM]|uniref:Chlorosome envelope protein B n=2 Tax=Prosthecochloris aestuarii TaxID=1102 RepID=B4S864_PROA2|nr:hypothetical protein [Prosthecochloris sp. ZM]ACF46251.1 conserved hypothetical protein [Prosthecochloris aestuarii DSM 271]RDD30215.1 hypothetical protein CR161_05560 [Prosthecochloris sp. ZM]
MITTGIINTHLTSDMANNNGVFQDLFNAVGTPVQNVADSVGDGVTSATSLVQNCADLCGTIITSSANTAIELIQNIASSISSAITPKQ